MSAFLIALISAALVGCASKSTSGSGQDTNPPGQVQNCGKISTSPRGTLADNAANKQAMDCFWHAYQSCQPATFTFTAIGLDAGLIHTFSTAHSAGKCVATDAMQHYIVPGPASAPVTYTCASVSQSGASLIFAGCGSDGVVTISRATGQ